MVPALKFAHARHVMPTVFNDMDRSQLPGLRFEYGPPDMPFVHEDHEPYWAASRDLATFKDLKLHLTRWLAKHTAGASLCRARPREAARSSTSVARPW